MSGRLPTYYFTIILAISLGACKKDPLIVIDDACPPGALCREYRFSKDKAAGYVDYVYAPSGLLERQRFIDLNERVKKHISFDYNPNRQLTGKYVYHAGSPQAITTYSYSYDERGNPVTECKITAAQTIKHQRTYNAQDQLVEELMFMNDSLHAFAKLSYNSEDSLYKRQWFNSDSSLHSYLTLEYYSNVVRENRYDGLHRLISYRITLYNDMKKVFQVNEYDEDGLLASFEQYDYNDNNRLYKQSFFHADSSLSAYFIFLYSD